ncbi:MAG: sacC, partial [Phycisphaerales bacterium]|nr:sacC [Phycisphaerales bacterium]
VVALSALSARAVAEPDHLIADFEGDTFAGWTVTGTAFGKGPIDVPLPLQQPVAGFEGARYVNSYHGTDKGQGTLTSPEFTITNNAISFLIGGGAHPGQTCINLLVNNKVVESATGDNDERLAWYTWDTKALVGKKAKIQMIDKETGQWGHINVDQIVQTDAPPVPALSTALLYQESYRPQFHFTAAKNWLNDPNGCVFYDGEYHLFFQHNPESVNWGNMTWGHAVSPDLVHWTQLPDALKPDKLGTMFSGSAVVDADNTSGFGHGNEKPLVAMYTAAGGTNPASKGQPFTQCIAFSNDKGRTWTKYAANPAIPHIAGENRDPKLIWHEATRKWIVALYLDGDQFALFGSPDLKKWTKLQQLGMPGCSECPDFFPLHLDGGAAKTKWIFTAANGHYLVGDFDGTIFTAEPGVQQADFGNSNYAVQTYSDIPAADGRRIQIGWMRDGKYPRMPFNQQMSFPAELQLKTTADGPRLFKQPIKEIETLHGKPSEWTDLKLNPGENPLAGLKGDCFHIKAEIEPGNATTVGFKIRGQQVVYRVADRKLESLGTAPLDLQNGRITLEILVDRTTIETFGNGGRVALSSVYLTKPEDQQLEVFADGGTAKIVSLSVFPVQSAWRSEPSALQK